MPRQFFSKHKRSNNLRRELEKDFYNRGVTDADLWREVGRLLVQARRNKGWMAAHNVYKHGGGPHNSNIGKHERGHVDKIDTLEKHALALDITVVDLFRAALEKMPERLSPQAREIARLFDAMPEKRRRHVLDYFDSLTGRSSD